MGKSRSSAAPFFFALVLATTLASAVVFWYFLQRMHMASPDYEVLSDEDGTQVITRSKQEVYKKIAKIAADGADNLQIITDFDMALTKFRLRDGSRGMSTHGLLERSGHFGPEYLSRAQALFDQYYPIEVDPTLDAERKRAAMAEWWAKSHALVVEQRVRRADLETCAAGGGIAFRDGVDSLLADAHARGVPVLIFSAGLGDVLDIAMRRHLGAWANVRVVANRMLFDEEGVVTGFHGETIHVLNKALFARKAAQASTSGQPRRNVVLLGDSLGDLGMAEGLDSDGGEVLRVGFLNDRVLDRRKAYLAGFDMVVLHDGPMTAVNRLLAPILAAPPGTSN